MMLNAVFPAEGNCRTEKQNAPVKEAFGFPYSVLDATLSNNSITYADLRVKSNVMPVCSVAVTKLCQFENFIFCLELKAKNVRYRLM